MEQNIYVMGWLCPRCGGMNVIEYDTAIECTDCVLEFSIEDIETTEDKSQVLSVQEKLHVSQVLYDQSDYF